MDPPTIVKTFKYNPSQQQPIFTTHVLEQAQPLHFKSFSQNKNPTFEDISFSSYLKPPKDTTQKPQENDHDTEISIFDAQKYFCENTDPKLIKTHHHLKKEPSSQEALPRLSSVSSTTDGYGKNFRTRSFHATPTASSEASWNSQTGLLANPPGSVGVGVSLKNFSPHDNSKKTSSSGNKKWIFGRKCCCTGKKSVRVKEATTLGPTTRDKSNPKSDSHKAKALSNNNVSQRSSITSDITPPDPLVLPSPDKNNFPAPAASAVNPPRQQRISASGRSFADGTGGFSFPILKNPTQAAVRPGGLKGMITKAIISPVEEDPPRDSLEVFQPMDNPVNAARHHLNPGSPIARVESTDDDLGSDASSDLFELESFSTQTTLYPMYRRRDSLDEAPTFNARRFASTNGLNLNNNNNSIQYGRRSLDETPTPSVAATECYAPSEVSIDWSVTTAECFDRASVSNFSVSASEIGGAAFFRQRLQEEAGGGGGGDGKRKGNGGGGLLLMSCRQGKAVSVGPQPMKCSPAAEGGGGTPVYAMHVGGRPPRASKTTMLGNDHSGRLSLAFAA